MIAKCQCMHCDIGLEYESEQFVESFRTGKRIFGQNIICPNCEKETPVYRDSGFMMAGPAETERASWKPWLIVLIVLVLILMIGLVAANLHDGKSKVMTLIEGFAFALIAGIAIIGAMIVYFLPSILGRHKRNSTAILVLNAFLGWSLVGWVIALVWACTVEPEQK